ncbi:copper chaperone PCu(A)C [Corynebacterium lubricantis]|uniref:copper chaperone PCu(A)C n=1 Tax=Corynebacterium lubricantis TaxID=541095 RepID=UPI00038203A6|nr:copper chaperone PCu(A)C [Corynebacterium lubricantis]
MSRRLTTGIAVLAAAVTLVACGDSTNATSDSATNTAAETTASEETVAANAEAIVLEEPVVRAMEAGKGMTGVFGTLVNSTDQDINIVDFSTSLGEPVNELHEVVDGVMQEKDGGFVVPANGTYELAPGADHMMIMDYEEAIEAGDVIDVTIEDSEGNTYDVADVPVRTLLPGDENYGEDGGLEGHNPDAEMGDSDMGDMEMQH